MPYPHISAVLNNCPLHVLTPSIKTTVERISQLGESTVSSFYKQYERLKNCFAEYYGIDPVQFDWMQFNQILQYYNAFDVQMILGPVLRLFFERRLSDEDMQETLLLMKLGDDGAAEMSDIDFVKTKTTVQSSGRYASLSPDEIFACIAKPLGINITYHKREQICNLGESDQHFQSLFHIHIYHQGGAIGAQAGGHWELTPNEDYEVLEKPPQLSAHARLLSADMEYITLAGLDLLKQQIRLTYKVLVCKENRKEDLSLLAKTIAQISKFIFDISYVVKRLALRLLGERVTEQTQRFIDNYVEPEIDYDHEFQTLIEANLNVTTQPASLKLTNRRYTPEEYHRALILLTPVVVSEGPLQIDDMTNPAKRRELRADEISRLRHVEAILYQEGLSGALYHVCNKPTITPSLTDFFIEILIDDVHFFKRASKPLQERARVLCPQKFADAKNRFQSKKEKGHAHLSERYFTTSPAVTSQMLMVELMRELKSSLSNFVLMGIGLDEKSAAIDQLISKAQKPDANLQNIYLELVKVVTTHRTRLGLFFHLSRSNSSTTHTAIALSYELVEPKYKSLKKALGIEAKTAEELQVTFDQLVANQDYYLFDLAGLWIKTDLGGTRSK